MPGPVPKAEHELTRPRSRRGGSDKEKPLTVGIRQPKTLELQEDPEWHDIAKYVWRAATTSGQYDYYQDSDIAMLYNLCEELSMYKNPKVSSTGEEYHKRSGQMFTAIMSSMQSLLLTEGDRRRVRLELKEQVEERPDLKVVGMSQYRDVAEAAG